MLVACYDDGAGVHDVSGVCVLQEPWHVSQRRVVMVQVWMTCVLSVCCRNPDMCPSVVSLLSESYNPHVRYGAAMALGIACAGTGLKVSTHFVPVISTRKFWNGLAFLKYPVFHFTLWHTCTCTCRFFITTCLMPFFGAKFVLNYETIEENAL